MEVKRRGPVRSGWFFRFCFFSPSNQPRCAQLGLLTDTTGQKERGRTEKPQELGAPLNECEPSALSLLSRVEGKQKEPWSGWQKSEKALSSSSPQHHWLCISLQHSQHKPSPMRLQACAIRPRSQAAPLRLNHTRHGYSMHSSLKWEGDPPQCMPRV